MTTAKIAMSTARTTATIAEIMPKAPGVMARGTTMAIAAFTTTMAMNITATIAAERPQPRAILAPERRGRNEMEGCALGFASLPS